MSKQSWTYNLRIVERKPEEIQMDRFSDYVRVFAELLGSDNKPTFHGVLEQSTGICAVIPPQYAQQVKLRLIQASNEPDSKPARTVDKLQKMMGEDGLNVIQLKDYRGTVLYEYAGVPPVQERSVRIKNDGTVDGQVLGISGTDATMHLQLRDSSDQVHRLVVKDEELARELLRHFRDGLLRVSVSGFWERTECGWVPDSKCVVSGFEELDDSSISSVIDELRKIEGNGWNDIASPQDAWKEMRGIH